MKNLMDTLFLACLLFLGLCAFAYGAETFIPATEDNVVISKDIVRVQQRVTTETTEYTTWTLKEIDNQIAALAVEKIVIDNKITELKRIKALVDAEAEKVKLKVKIIPLEPK